MTYVIIPQRHLFWRNHVRFSFSRWSISMHLSHVSRNSFSRVFILLASGFRWFLLDFPLVFTLRSILFLIGSTVQYWLGAPRSLHMCVIRSSVIERFFGLFWGESNRFYTWHRTGILCLFVLLSIFCLSSSTRMHARAYSYANMRPLCLAHLIE
jgi:hypothetical protein